MRKMAIKNLKHALFFLVVFNVVIFLVVHAQKQVMRQKICIISPKGGAIRMELPLYSAVIHIVRVRHCALLEHFLSQLCVCKAGLRGITSRKILFFHDMNNGPVYAA